MSKMLVRKILREPIVNITEAAGTGREQYCLAAVRTLFKLEEAGKEEYRDNETCRRHPRQ
jgi:Glutamyl-tRNA reductase